MGHRGVVRLALSFGLLLCALHGVCCYLFGAPRCRNLSLVVVHGGEVFGQFDFLLVCRLLDGAGQVGLVMTDPEFLVVISSACDRAGHSVGIDYVYVNGLPVGADFSPEVDEFKRSK